MDPKKFNIENISPEIKDEQFMRILMYGNRNMLTRKYVASIIELAKQSPESSLGFELLLYLIQHTTNQKLVKVIFTECIGSFAVPVFQKLLEVLFRATNKDPWFAAIQSIDDAFGASQGIPYVFSSDEGREKIIWITRRWFKEQHPGCAAALRMYAWGTVKTKEVSVRGALNQAWNTISRNEIDCKHAKRLILSLRETIPAMPSDQSDSWDITEETVADLFGPVSLDKAPVLF